MWRVAWVRQVEARTVGQSRPRKLGTSRRARAARRVCRSSPLPRELAHVRCQPRSALVAALPMSWTFPTSVPSGSVDEQADRGRDDRPEKTCRARLRGQQFRKQDSGGRKSSALADTSSLQIGAVSDPGETSCTSCCCERRHDPPSASWHVDCFAGEKTVQDHWAGMQQATASCALPIGGAKCCRARQRCPTTKDPSRAARHGRASLCPASPASRRVIRARA